ncbi:hypothetical protein [Mycoplasma leonicaptivi]|uniref:hypothetical protein n=1 Tax=Mycoplasma leonicaptivi TaxID=36742 RepID=UPI00047F7D6B|nr:hypothetical protein [Mycoplasma leonicaptivi]
MMFFWIHILLCAFANIVYLVVYLKYRAFILKNIIKYIKNKDENFIFVENDWCINTKIDNSIEYSDNKSEEFIETYRNDKTFKKLIHKIQKRYDKDECLAILYMYVVNLSDDNMFTVSNKNFLINEFWDYKTTRVSHFWA